MDRLQILRVARLESFNNETGWYAEIENRRIALWAQLLRDLNRIVAQLKCEETDTPDTLRMADWAFVAMTIGQAIGAGGEIHNALDAAELDKAHFLLEADDLYDLIHALAADHPDTDWKAGELVAELKRRAESVDIEFRIRSPRSLGRILHRLEPALTKMIRFGIRDDAHEGQSIYSFGPLAKLDADSSTEQYEE